ncbi:uncharacterized protein LOC135226131 [Macrobrachium nipponense]|uniref:uncharacterized protein LOC135226131 n=1 Tax=Macrobrachium nipponense TaxID=159736 RepID=UPI0030C7F9C6
MFKWFNKVSVKSRPTQAHHPNPQAEANRLAQHFVERTKSTHLPPATRERQEALNPERWRIINTACNNFNDTDTPFTMKELDKALQKGADTASGADMITYSMLKNMAQQPSVKGNLLAWAKGYIQDRQARVTFQGATSEILNLENGTPHGGILSPFLFNIPMEKLANSNLPNGVEIFIYADDVCLVSTDRHRAHQNMQNAITQIENKCTVLGLKINTVKTKAMAIKHNTDLNPIQLMGEPIELVDNFMYLGVNINKQLSPCKEIETLKHKIKCRQNTMKRITSLRQGAIYHAHRTFYIQTIRSTVEYAATVLTYSSSKQASMHHPTAKASSTRSNTNDNCHKHILHRWISRPQRPSGSSRSLINNTQRELEAV